MQRAAVARTDQAVAVLPRMCSPGIRMCGLGIVEADTQTLDRAVASTQTKDKVEVLIPAADRAVVSTQTEDKVVVSTRKKDKALVLTLAPDRAVVSTLAKERVPVRALSAGRAVVSTLAKEWVPVRAQSAGRVAVSTLADPVRVGVARAASVTRRFTTVLRREEPMST